MSYIGMAWFSPCGVTRSPELGVVYCLRGFRLKMLLSDVVFFFVGEYTMGGIND